MIKYLTEHPWKIVEEDFNPDRQKNSESLFSLGNGHMGHRANFEEEYSGLSLQGHYIAGIYYPDKTRVGWWKNGYPEYFAKVLNAPSWIGLNIRINNKAIDLNKMTVRDFKRILNMKEGILYRSFEAEFDSGEAVKVSAERFLSLSRKETGCIKYSIELLKGNGSCEIEFYLDGGIQNQDSNYNEKFWEPVNSRTDHSYGFLTSRTKKTGFTISTGMSTSVFLNGRLSNQTPDSKEEKDRIGLAYHIDLAENDKLTLFKYASVFTSRDHGEDHLEQLSADTCKEANKLGYEKLKKEQISSWQKKWEESDIRIEGDLLSQQAIRFSIFQLNQTYTGHDPRLNIGPKGFTGEKYGGSTYWDSEAYCLPFYLKTTSSEIARNLLIYRHNHLGKAIENAEKLGFMGGAALYPMVTMNGEECHNEWEITFEEIHRNGVIAYAIYNYIRHTGDISYMDEYGLEVIVAIARFWVQRANYSAKKGKFVILGVTGPNEYENNINNNWYTNYIAVWTLKYAIKSLESVKTRNPKRFKELSEQLKLKIPEEHQEWQDVANQMYLPEDNKLGIFLQQEGYMDKEQLRADEIPEEMKPLNQNWSWDRILRSCFIKQADVLQGLYLFEDQFDLDTLRRNFDFYEPRTVHESSLSPSLHAILACKLGKKEKAYELYLRTARLDLDDWNNEVDEGCHITSMAGSWLSVVEGFGGMRIKDDLLHFNPLLPDSWDSLEFMIRFRGRKIRIKISREKTELFLVEGGEIGIYLNNKLIHLS